MKEEWKSRKRTRSIKDSGTLGDVSIKQLEVGKGQYGS